MLMKEVLKNDTALSKKAYKETKLGLIPQDWSVRTLDSIGEFSKGKGIAKKDILDDDIDGLPCIRYAEIYTLYDYNTASLKSNINQESAENSNPIAFGDILFAGSGETLEDIGKSIAYLNEETAYAGGDICILKQKNQDSRYLGYLLNSDVVRNQLFKIGQGHSVVHIYSSGLKKVLVPLPPLPEQQKIASILNTWDKAIAAQENLIARKEEFKIGLMQQLLTGKKRFSGFTQKWSSSKLIDIFSIQGRVGWKGYRKEDLRNQGPLVIGAKHIKNQLLDISDPTHLSIEKYEESPEIMIRQKDLLIVQRGSLGKVMIIEKEIGKATINPSMAILRPKTEKVLVKFIYYFLCSDYSQNLILSETGSTGVPMISQKQIGTFKVSYPTKHEQLKMVTLFESLDDELHDLKKYNNYLIKQKCGLMQQLLTGEKRVKL
jgi:type I restriction enzyme S subunit